LIGLLYQHGKDVNGHEITAFAVGDPPAGSEAGEFIIYAYDSNTPFHTTEDSDGAEHEAGQSLSDVVVHANGSWFDERLKATGPATALSVVPASVEDGPLHLESKAYNSLLIAPGTNIDLLRDPSTGQPVDLGDGGSGDVAVSAEEEEGSSASTTNAMSAPAPTTAASELGGVNQVLGPQGRWAETLSAAGPLSASFFSTAFTGVIHASSGHDSIVLDSRKDSIELAPAAGEAPSSSATVTLIESKGGGSERILTVSGPGAKAHLSASLVGSLASLSATASGRFDVQLSVEGNNIPWQTYDAGTISLRPGQKLALKPASWNRLGSGRIAATLTSKHGRRSLHIHNHFRAPAARVLSASVSRSGHTAKLEVNLRLPALQADEAVVELKVTVRHAGHVLTQASVPVPIGPTHSAAVTVALARSIPKGSTAQFTLSTETGGATPSSATTRRKVSLR
jgi:hypothetical protein